MLYKIYKLRFNTPVRFGLDAGAETQLTFCADTLFSALYLSLKESGREDAFLKEVMDRQLVFSDALPFHENDLYIPRPVGIYTKQLDEDMDPSIRKQLKKIKFIPAKHLYAWLDGILKPEDISIRFGVDVDRTRVNKTESIPLPYQVEGFQFYNNCGLYIIAAGKDNDAIQTMSDAMMLLSATGIGGKASSGWGHFDLEVSELTEAVILEGLMDQNAPSQMLLSTAFPDESEAEGVMLNARYILKRRGGFTGGQMSKPVKKRTTWFLAAGSTFSQRFNGVVTDVKTVSPHPVWRYGKALMMGVKTK